MATPCRIYLVLAKFGDAKRLVRAPNAAQALRFVANDFTVAVASQDELVAAVGDGVTVEESGSAE